MHVSVLKEPLGEVTQDSLCLGRRQKGPLISGAFPPSLSLPPSLLSLPHSLSPSPSLFPPLSLFLFLPLSLPLSLLFLFVKLRQINLRYPSNAFYSPLRPTRCFSNQ